MAAFSHSPTAIICLSPFHGGMELDAIRTAKLLQDTCKITLIFRRHSPLQKYYQHQMEKDGFSVETVTFRFAFSLRLAIAIRSLIKRHGIRNILFFGASEMRSLFFSCLGKDINLIVRHGTTKSHSKKDFLHRIIYSQVNWHVAICKHIANNVRKIIPFGPNTRLKVIYSSLRFSDTTTRYIPVHNRDDRSLTILHVGRITGGKGQIDAIKACRILHEKKIRFSLVFVGEIDPAFRKILEQEMEQCGFKDQITFTGYMTDTTPYYQKADLFLFPSYGEGLSNAFIEALSFGLTCIAYANTSFPELNQLGFKFYLAEDRNIDDLQKRLIDAINDRRTNGPCEQNIHLAHKCFSAQRERQDFLEILK